MLIQAKAGLPTVSATVPLHAGGTARRLLRPDGAGDPPGLPRGGSAKDIDKWIARGEKYN